MREDDFPKVEAAGLRHRLWWLHECAWLFMMFITFFSQSAVSCRPTGIWGLTRTTALEIMTLSDLKKCTLSYCTCRQGQSKADRDSRISTQSLCIITTS
jgi:hypothetical protein